MLYYNNKRSASIRVKTNPNKIQQFSTLFSTTCFGPKSHHHVEHNNKRNIYRIDMWK